MAGEADVAQPGDCAVAGGRRDRSGQFEAHPVEAAGGLGGAQPVEQRMFQRQRGREDRKIRHVHMLDRDAQSVGPDIQTQSPGQPGRSRQSQTQIRQIQMPSLGTAFPD